jgi:hypothetical protein
MGNDLNEVLKVLQAKLATASEKRAELEIELRDKDIEIQNTNKAISSVLTLMGLAFDVGISEMGITDAIRQVTYTMTERFTATDVREQLEKKGFKLSGYDNPMASIYKILTRLAESGELDVEKEGWNTFYKAKAKRRRFHVRHHRRGTFGDQKPVTEDT